MFVFIAVQALLLVLAVLCLGIAHKSHKTYELRRRRHWDEIRDLLRVRVEALRADPLLNWGAYFQDQLHPLLEHAREVTRRERDELRGSDAISRLLRGESTRDEMRISQLGMWAFLNLTWSFTLVGFLVGRMFQGLDTLQWIGWVLGALVWAALTGLLYWSGRVRIPEVQRGLRSVIGTRTPWGVYIEGEVWRFWPFETIGQFSIGREPIPFVVDNVRTSDGGKFTVEGIVTTQVDMFRLFAFSRMGWDRFEEAFLDVTAAVVREYFPGIQALPGQAGPWEAALTIHDGASRRLESAIVGSEFDPDLMVEHGVPDRHEWGVLFMQVRITDIIPQGELAEHVAARANESAQRVRETENNVTASTLARQIVVDSHGADGKPTVPFKEAYTLVRQLQLVQEGKGSLTMFGGTMLEGMQAIAARLMTGVSTPVVQPRPQPEAGQQTEEGGEQRG